MSHFINKLTKHCNFKSFHLKILNSFENFKVSCYFNMIGSGVIELKKSGALRLKKGTF